MDDPNGVIINIATPGWNEYEEEVNCPQPTAKSAGSVKRAYLITVAATLVMSVSFLL